jgi:hypothetical protein
MNTRSNTYTTPCGICRQAIRGDGHNGWPLVNGAVCDGCNRTVIIARLGEMMLRRGDE